MIPLKDTYIKIKPSTIDLDGVGVFAIRDIPEGTKIGENYGSSYIYLEEIQRLPSEVVELLLRIGHHCGAKNHKAWWAPRDLTVMDLINYLNKDEDHPTISKDLRTLRFIEKGEELTCSYRELVR